jgi:hypothetical protein
MSDGARLGMSRMMIEPETWKRTKLKGTMTSNRGNCILH